MTIMLSVCYAPSRFLPPRDLWGKNSGGEESSSRCLASSRRLNARIPRHHHRESVRPSFSWDSSSTRSVSLRGCEWHDFVRLEWRGVGWQPFTGGFGCGRVSGFCDWPRPLAVILFMQRQTQSRWWTHPRHDKGCQWARAQIVSAWGAISQQGWTSGFCRGAIKLSGQHPCPIFPEVHDKLTKSRRAPYSSRIRSSASATLTSIDGAEEKGYRVPAPSRWVRGHTSLSAHVLRSGNNSTSLF